MSKTGEFNVHEEVGRLRKVRALVPQIDAALLAVGIQPNTQEAADMVRGFGLLDWTAHSRRVGVHPPSDETIAAVRKVYEQRVEAVAKMHRDCAAEVERAGKAPSVMALAARASRADKPCPVHGRATYFCRKGARCGQPASRTPEQQREHDDGLHAFGADR